MKKMEGEAIPEEGIEKEEKDGEIEESKKKKEDSETKVSKKEKEESKTKDKDKQKDGTKSGADYAYGDYGAEDDLEEEEEGKKTSIERQTE